MYFVVESSELLVRVDRVEGSPKSVVTSKRVSSEESGGRIGR